MTDTITTSSGRATQTSASKPNSTPVSNLELTAESPQGSPNRANIRASLMHQAKGETSSEVEVVRPELLPENGNSKMPVNFTAFVNQSTTPATAQQMGQRLQDFLSEENGKDSIPGEEVSRSRPVSPKQLTPAVQEVSVDDSIVDRATHAQSLQQEQEKKAPWYKRWSEAGLSGIASVGSVLKGISDQIGITSLVVGVGHSIILVPHLCWDAGRVLTGQGSVSELTSNAFSHLKGVGTGLVGAGKCFVELTGIADLYRAVEEGCKTVGALLRGDTAAAKQHAMMMVFNGVFAALSIGSIAATVATGGAAAGSIAAVAAGRMAAKQAVKAVLKEGAEQFFKHGAAQIGEMALKDMVQNAPKVLASREGGAALLKQVEQQAAATGRPVAELAYKELLQLEGKSGAIHTAKIIAEKGVEGASLQGAEKISRDVGEQRTKALLKELGLVDIVDNHTFDLLKTNAGKGQNELASELGTKFGLESKHADRMAKEIKKALKSGKADAEIKQLLEDGIQKPISESLQQGMEAEFKTTMRKAVRGESSELGETVSKQLKEAVEENAKRSGKTLRHYGDELVEATWKGYREGIECGTRLVVREGIENAFKRFREKRNSRGGGSSATTRRSVQEEKSIAEEASESTAVGNSHGADAARPGGHENMTRERTVIGSKGEIVHIREVFETSQNQWKVVDSEIEKVSNS